MVFDDLQMKSFKLTPHIYYILIVKSTTRLPSVKGTRI